MYLTGVPVMLDTISPVSDIPPRPVSKRWGEDAEDLAAPKMRDASPGRATARSTRPAEAGALPSGTVIGVDRAVDGNGIADLADQRVKVGAELARRRVTLRLDGHLMHIISDGVLAKTLPSPSQLPTAASCVARVSSRPRSSRPLRVRSASSARSPKTASSWSPASACASAPSTLEDRHYPR